MTHCDEGITLRLYQGERGATPPPAPRGQPGRDELLTRTAELCDHALAAARTAAPAPELVWLAEQLADTSRLLNRVARAGVIAADAYELGRADERAAARLRPA
jgi:hypothetical protein